MNPLLGKGDILEAVGIWVKAISYYDKLIKKLLYRESWNGATISDKINFVLAKKVALTLLTSLYAQNKFFACPSLSKDNEFGAPNVKLY